MQINLNNFVPNLSKQAQISKFSNIHFGSNSIDNDVFVKSTENDKPPSKMDLAIEYAKEACAKTMQDGDNAFEHIVIIDKDGNVYHEGDGDEGSCSMRGIGIKEGSVVVHGHPKEGLEPFSAADFESFLGTKNIKQIIVVDKNKKACTATKPDGFKLDMNPTKISEKIRNINMVNFIKAADLTPNFEINDSYIEIIEKQLKQKTGIEDTEQLYLMLTGIGKPDTPEQCKLMLEYPLMMRGMEVPNPLNATFSQAYNILEKDRPQFIEATKDFNKEVAKEFGLDWECKED